MISLINILDEMKNDYSKELYSSSKVITRQFAFSTGSKVNINLYKLDDACEISFLLPSDVDTDSFRKIPSWKGMEIHYLSSADNYLEFKQVGNYDRRIFVQVMQDVIDAVELAGLSRTIFSVIDVLSKWSSFFKRNEQTTLSEIEQQGLYGELCVFEKLLKSRNDVVACWTGCMKETHDYYTDANAIEVKTSCKSGPDIIKVSNEYQLDDSDVDSRLFSKQYNEKILESIIEKLVYRENLPDWFNNNISDARGILENILAQHSSTTEQMSELMEFWNIHRYFQGLVELANKDAIFEHELENHAINVRLHTYIVIDYVHKALKNLGYKIKGEVLNAAKYGVPQTRERYILVGIYSPEKDVEIPMPEPIIDNPLKFVTVHEAIKDLESIEPTTGAMDDVQRRINLPTINSYFRELVMKEGYRTVNNHVCTATTALSLERFEQIEPGKNFHSLPDELKSQYENPSRTQNTVYRRLDPNMPSETVVNVRKSMWIHPKFNRAVSAREAARLQSFPDDYIFYGTKDSVYQQIGNAVPPVLGRAVAEVVLDLLGVDKGNYRTLASIYKKCKK